MQTEVTDRQWYENNIVRTGEHFLYGRLQDDMESIPADEFWAQLKQQAQSYLDDGENRAGRVQQRVDGQIDSLIARDTRFGYPAPFCHKGCANCCHEIVYCTDDEAKQIIEFCQNNDVVIDTDKLKRQLAHVEFDEQNNHTGATRWHDQPLEDQSCIFLNQQGRFCNIWQVRPLVCRVHLAEDTDQYCKPHNGVENPNARGISYIELSYILSAVFTYHQDSIRKTMGQLIVKHLSQ